MKFLIILFSIVLLEGITPSFGQTKESDWIYQLADKQLAEEKLQAFSSKSSLPIGELIIQIGFSFAGTPYVAATLENGMEEKLVVNLRELDCTTFVENCLALARTVKKGKTDFASFATELERIRYRDAKRNLYPSRLHYFSEWIHNNQAKGIVTEKDNQKGVLENKAINFMSTHPASYPVLKAHPETVKLIEEQENRLNQQGFYYFPKDQLPNLYKYLQQGDIVGLTSSINGLDINHTGIIIQKENNFYLLHASQSAGKVMVADEPLSEFLKPTSKNSGVMIARPLF